MSHIAYIVARPNNLGSKVVVTNPAGYEVVHDGRKMTYDKSPTPGGRMYERILGTIEKMPIFPVGATIRAEGSEDPIGSIESVHMLTETQIPQIIKVIKQSTHQDRGEIFEGLITQNESTKTPALI